MRLLYLMVRFGLLATVFLILIAWAFSVRSARADYILVLNEVGPNVVASGNGAIDLTGLSFNGTGGSQAYIGPSIGTIQNGPAPFVPAVDYTGFSGPTSFGSGSGRLASSGSGDRVGIVGNAGLLVVPQGYVSGNPLSDTSTYDNETFSSLGVTPGTYVWSWGSGADQRFTVQIGPVVPESSSLRLLALGGLLLIVVTRRERCSWLSE